MDRKDKFLNITGILASLILGGSLVTGFAFKTFETLSGHKDFVYKDLISIVDADYRESNEKNEQIPLTSLDDIAIKGQKEPQPNADPALYRIFAPLARFLSDLYRAELFARLDLLEVDIKKAPDDYIKLHSELFPLIIYDGGKIPKSIEKDIPDILYSLELCLNLKPDENMERFVNKGTLDLMNLIGMRRLDYYLERGARVELLDPEKFIKIDAIISRE